MVKKYKNMRFIGGKVTDTCYTHEIHGMFNVTKMEQAIKDKAPYIEKVKFYLNDTIKRANDMADVSDEVVKSMTLERALQPLIILMDVDGLGIIVDGNNRMRWLINNGFTLFLAYMIPFSHMEEFRLKAEGQKEDGSWEEVDPKESLMQSLGTHFSAKKNEELLKRMIDSGKVTQDML